MNIIAVRKELFSLSTLSVFSKVSTVILLVFATLLATLGLLVHQPVVLIVAGVELLIVALITAGIRWAPLMGSVIGSLVLYIFLFATGYPIHHLTHPKDAFGYGVTPVLSFLMFTLMLILFWCGAMLVVTGIAAVMQNYFQRERRTPRWFRTALIGALCLWFGAFLLGAISQPEPAVAANPSGAPTVHLQAGSFGQSSITLSKGATLTLVDDGPFTHNISNGTWVNGQPQAESQSGAPTVNHLVMDTAGKSTSIGPFAIAGTYHLYCSLHPGMTLTIIVQ
ncbi:MAG TPA: plastocyanin/azurin family copper-binding protein [Ktedonosporobacter sp.]|nr:plastocyanin/azurin family copper-binding protein [Ktedonosporobacter sp.]